MKRKTRTKALSWLLSLALVLGLMSGMSLTAYAETSNTGIEVLITDIDCEHYKDKTTSFTTDDGLANISFSATPVFDEYHGWYNPNGDLTITVTAANEDYPISKCMFQCDRPGRADNTDPFEVTISYDGNWNNTTATINDETESSGGLKHIGIFSRITPDHTALEDGMLIKPGESIIPGDYYYKTAEYVNTNDPDRADFKKNTLYTLVKGNIESRQVDPSYPEWVEDVFVESSDGDHYAFLQVADGKYIFDGSWEVTNHADGLLVSQGTSENMNNPEERITTYAFSVHEKVINDVTVDSTIENGSIEIKDSEGTAISEAEAGSIVTLDVSADEGYKLKEISANYLEVQSVSELMEMMGNTKYYANPNDTEYSDYYMATADGIKCFWFNGNEKAFLSKTAELDKSKSAEGVYTAIGTYDDAPLTWIFKVKNGKIISIGFERNGVDWGIVNIESTGTIDEPTYASVELTPVTTGKQYTFTMPATDVTVNAVFAEKHTHDGIDFTAWGNATGLPDNAGNYYLTQDVILSETWKMPSGTTNLCLDGHSITAAEGKEIQLMDVENGATLNLYDKEDNSGSISGAVSVNGAILVNSGTFNMYGGTIKDNMTTDHGAGVRVQFGGTFSLYGGSIENNKTQSTTGGCGGGVHVEQNSTFNMYGGSIKNNTAAGGAGVFIGSNCTFNLSGGSITGNIATNGEGGVSFTSDSNSPATFKLSGNPTVTDNIFKFDDDMADFHISDPSNVILGEEMKIEVVGALTGDGKISISKRLPGVFTNSSNSVKASDYIDKFATDSRMYRIKTEGDDLRIEAPHLVVGGTFVYDDNAADVFGDGKVKFTPASDENSNAKLTLNGYQYDGREVSEREGIVYFDNIPLDIVLKGENIIKVDNAPGIMINAQANTVISSDNGGSLEVESAQGDAIYANGALTVESGTISATGGNRGIAANGINLNGGKIVAKATGEQGYGIYCDNLPWLPANSVSINSGISSLIASGTLGAVYGGVANALEGLGWSNITGTDGQKTIAVTAEARSLEYKKVAFVSHTHSFTYSASGATITATCANADGGCTLTDNKVTLTIAAPDNLTYDKSAKAAVVTDANAIQGTAKVQYQTKSGDAYGEATETAPTNAGTYKASITVGGATASVEYTIAKADPTYTAPTGLTATYGQTLADVTLTNPSGNTAGTWAWADSRTSVGNFGTNTFKASFVPTDTTNYNTKTNIDVSVTVGKANITPTVSIEGWTYGQEANAPSVSGNTGNGAVTYTYATKGSDNFSATVPANAGNYTVKATIAANANYSGGTATADFTIAKVNITPTVSIDGWTYNQTAKTPSVSGNSGNGAVTYTYATKGSDNFSATVPTNAGNYTVKATIAATANYNGGTATADFTIAKANITPTVTLEGWTYGQEANAPSISGNTGNGAVTYTYATKGSDNFSATVPTNAGDYIVKATIAESGKYNGGEATKNFTIAKKAATITVEAKSKTYSDVDPTLTATVDGTVGGDTLNYTLSRTEGNNFGEYDITVNLGENPNYEITAIGAKLTINKKAVTITAKNQSIYVGGTVPALEGVDFYTVTGLVGEDTLTTQPTLAYQKDGNAASPVNTTAGTYDIVPSGADAGGNYEITYENGILTISRRSSSGGGVSTYAITPVKADNGSVSVSRTTAVKGNTVTITVKPDKGYKVGNVTVIDALGKAVKVTQNDDGTYTFTQPSSKVTITPVFVKEGDEPTAPPTDPTTPPADNDNPFADVKNGDYFYNPVLWAAKENITSGTTDTTFSPNESCTRGQTVTFLWRAAGSPEPTTTVNPFTDVKENDYFYKAVLWAYENGITQGTSVSEFSPSATVTRGQTVTFLYRSAGENTNGENPFTDVRAGDYYYDSVLWAYGNDITSGTSIATFSPNEDCLRGQIVTFLYRCK